MTFLFYLCAGIGAIGLAITLCVAAVAIAYEIRGDLRRRRAAQPPARLAPVDIDHLDREAADILDLERYRRGTGLTVIAGGRDPRSAA